MPAVPTKEMLSQVLTRGTLSKSEREVFEGMWDAIHRYGGLSRKQVAWIEDKFYKLNKNPAIAPTKRAPKKGRVDVPGLAKAVNARSLEHFKKLHPNASPEMVKRIEAFFKSGGELVELRPANA